MWRPVHYFGCFLLFAAAILIMITTISAPVVNSISILRIDLANSQSSVTFGTFGYCILNAEQGGDACSGRHIGYDVANIVYSIEQTGFSEAGANTANGLTRVMILHPIASGLTFIGFLIALGAGIIGSLAGLAVTFVAWVLTLVVMATDFSWGGIVKNDVNSDGTGSNAYYGSGMWTLLAAFILQFIGMVIVFFTCCSARRQKKKDRAVVEPKNDYGTATHKRRFWQRRH